MPLNICDTYNPFVRQKAHDMAGLPERKGSQNIRTQPLSSPDNSGTADTQTPNLTENGVDTYSGIMKQKKVCDCQFI